MTRGCGPRGRPEHGGSGRPAATKASPRHLPSQPQATPRWHLLKTGVWNLTAKPFLDVTSHTALPLPARKPKQTFNLPLLLEHSSCSINICSVHGCRSKRNALSSAESLVPGVGQFAPGSHRKPAVSAATTNPRFGGTNLKAHDSFQVNVAFVTYIRKVSKNKRIKPRKGEMIKTYIQEMV